jgi:lipoprotein-anchoring transpeptidase ErfK/SrfK
MQWALDRLREAAPVETQRSVVSRLPAVSAPSAPAPAAPPAAGRKTRPVAPILLVAIGLFVCMLAGISAMMSPVLASIVQKVEPTHAPSWALASIPKPTYTPNPPVAFEMQPTLGVDEAPTEVQELATEISSPEASSLTEEATLAVPATQEVPSVEPTWSGTLGMEFVNDTPTVQAPAPDYAAGAGEHWIDVNLSQQTVYAYAGDSVVNSFLVSTGTWLHPTVTGRYHVYTKLRYTDMSGPDYYLPNVPYTMYFFKGYGLHGTYWHHNFGTPMSHGCVNLSIPDAEWLYNFSSVGTLVNVHY